MTISGEVLGFVKAHHSDGVLSVYINSTFADPAKRFVWQKSLKDGLRRAHARAADVPTAVPDEYEQCAAHFEKLIPDAATFTGKAGWMCLCAANGDHVESWLSVPPADKVVWDVGPNLFPYLKATQTDAAIIVQVDLAHARIGRMLFGQIQPLESHDADEVGDVGTHMGDAPRSGFHTGTRGETATDAAQRQRRDAQERLMATVRKRLAVIAGEKQPIVIGGSAEATAHFMADLPAELVARAELAPTLRMTTPPPDVVALTQAALTDLLTRRQLAMVSALERRPHTMSHSAFGYTSVNAAVAASAVEHLLISDAFMTENVVDAELLLRQALLSGTRVEIAMAKSAEVLNSVARGIAAKLRFPVPTEELALQEANAT